MNLAPLEMSCTEASIQGVYRPDRFVMTVPDVLEKPLTFVHEYFHYLHNITTVHGVRSFEATQQLLAMFSRTMSLRGVSEGDRLLTPRERDFAAQYARTRRHYEGEIFRETDMHVSGEVIGRTDDRLRFALKWPGVWSQREEEFRLGGRAIKESIAHLIERHVADLMGLDPPRAPEFPYAVLERLFAFLAPGEREQPLTIAALGTLALLTVDAGRAVSKLFEDYTKFRGRGLLVRDALDAVADQVVRTEYQRNADVVTGTDLPSIVEMHRGRATEKAVAFLCSESTRALKRRLKDPLFDLRPFLGNYDPEYAMRDLTELFRDVEPCEVLLDGSVGSYRDRAKDSEGIDRTNHLMTLSAQQEFMLMHLHGEAFKPSAEVKGRCAFLHSCTHPNATEAPTSCEQTPWAHFKNSDTGCWFSTGVMATVGKGKLIRTE